MRFCISSEHQPVQGKDETFFRFIDPEEAPRLVLEERRNYLLAEAKSETLKQECKVDTLNTCIREFQRQACSNRLEMDNVNYGYEESRREQPRLHEELAQREKALRDTRIRKILEVEELKRAQEMRIDEFSKNELRDSHATTQELTSQIQELQERINHMNDSRGIQDEKSICSGIYPTFPVNGPSFQVFVELQAATKVCDLVHGSCLVHPIRHRLLIKECFTLRIEVLQAETQYEIVQGNLSLEVKNEIERLFQCRDMQGNHQP